MMGLLAVPALLSSGFFVGGGVYAYVAKRSLVSLLVASAFSGMLAGSSYVMMAHPDRCLGYCLAATTSLCALGFGAYRVFQPDQSNVKKRNLGIAIYSVGLGCSCFYLAVLIGKKLWAQPSGLHFKGA